MQMNQKEQLRKQHSQLIDQTVRELAQAYQKYHGSLTEFLTNALYADGVLQPAYSKTYIDSVIDQYTEAVQAEVERIAEEKVEEAFLLGLLMFYEDIGSPISMQQARKELSTTGISFKAKTEVKRLLSHTSSNTSFRIKRIVKQVFSDSLLYQTAQSKQQDRLLGLLEQTKSIKEFEKILQREGFVGIIDKRGYIWKPDVYAKMVLRTKLMEADAQTQKVKGEQSGIDLAWISIAHVDNPCNLWEGTIISLNGFDRRFPTYEQAKATGEVFHPNCQHYLNVIRDISLAPLSVISATEQKYGIDLSEYKN